MDFGMSRLGRVTYRESRRSPFFDGQEELPGERAHSEQTAREIDEEIAPHHRESLERVRHMLETRRQALVALAERLIEKEDDRQRRAEADHRGQLAQPDDRSRHGRHAARRPRTADEAAPQRGRQERPEGG